MPFTNGFSGPTITKSTFESFKNFKIFSKSLISKSIFFANSWVPALPGMQYILLTFEDKEIVLQMYYEALSRPPSQDELNDALTFLGEKPDANVLTDFAHVLFNTKEFIFIR